MLDEIYLRLLHELTPKPARDSAQFDMERLISNYDSNLHVQNMYGLLISANYAHDPGTDIGMRYGRLLQPHTLCDYTRTLMTCENLKHALELINALHYMLGNVFYVTTHLSDDGSVSISICYPFQIRTSLHQRQFFSEVVFSYLTNLLRHCIGQDIRPSKICFDTPEPAYSHLHAQDFLCKTYFDETLATIYFDRDVTQQPFKTASATLHSIFLTKCTDHVRKQEKTWPFEYRTSIQILRNTPQFFQASELASTMNLSVRGLQKKLNKYNASFSSLTTQARLALIKVALVQKNLNLEETAEQLGFQTVSGLRRFYKAETGVSLTDYYLTPSSAEAVMEE